jgi:hypothetical protein
VNTNLRSLGLEPTLLSDETITELIALAAKHRDRVETVLIPPRVSWRPDAQPAAVAAAS